MKPDQSLLVLSALLVVVAGCLDEGSQQSPAAASAEPLPQSGQLANSSTKTAYSGFFDQWERFQRATLLANAQRLEQTYLSRKKDSAIDTRTGKPRTATPMSVLLSPISKLPTSPAINTFEPHVNNPNSASIGDLSLDRAQLRVRVEDEKIQARWVFFTPTLSGRPGPVSRFTDAVGGARSFLALGSEINSAVTGSLKEGGTRKSGKSGAWTFEVRPLEFFSPTCITCHEDKKVGDLAGVMVYMAAPRQDGR